METIEASGQLEEVPAIRNGRFHQSAVISNHNSCNQ